MQKIRFNNQENVYEVSLKTYNYNKIKRCKITFSSSDVIDETTILSGFVELNEYNFIVQADFTDMKYLYKKESDTTYILSNTDGDVYVEPKPVVTFSASFGGTLDGETSQAVGTYKELVVPTPVPNENYKFVEWTPAIPTKGNVESSTTFTAKFEYVPTEEELQAEFESAKQNKIAELSSACQAAIYAGVDVGGKHYSYTLQDQKNLEDAITIASQTALEVPYHADGESCSLYSYVGLQQIYIAEQINLTQHTTYFNQMKQYIIDTFTDRSMIEGLQGIVYGTELTGTYLDTYNSIMEQSTLIMNALGEA